MRFSPQREAILKTLMATDNHPTAEWIFEQVRDNIPNISLGTVYRNLNQLSEAGMIKRILDDGHIRYDGNISRHDHLRCSNCNRIFDLEIEINHLERKIPVAMGFQVTGYSLEVSGLCRDCQTEDTDHNEGTN